MNLRSFSLYRNYSYPLILSNVGEPSWSWIPGDHIQVQKEKQISSLLVYVLHKTRNEAFSRRSRSKTGKEMWKKSLCTCKVVVLLIKPIVFCFFFLTSSLPSASLDLKVPGFVSVSRLASSFCSWCQLLELLLLIREVKHHVCVKQQTRIRTTWPSFLFTCRLLFILSMPKLVVSRNFFSIKIVLSCFYLLFFYFEKFSTPTWRLPFAVYVKIKLDL